VDVGDGTEVEQTLSKPIQLFVPSFRVDECLAAIRECLESGWTGMGFKTEAFEAAWRQYTGLPHAHFLNSATAGLHLAVRLLKEHGGWLDGDEVISTPLTFVSGNHAILYEGLRPVFADVDEYLCLDPMSIEVRITPRTRAVIFVGVGGSSGRLDAVRELCHRRGLRLIVDAAHMSGTRLGGRHVGSEGDVSVFSFHAVKNLPMADGGMICFADPALDREVRKWTWLGIDKDTYSRTMSDAAYKWYYEVDHVGFKYHGNSVMAALGLIGLRYLDSDNAYRRQLAQWYGEALAGTDTVRRVETPAGCESSRHLYQILVERRDEVMVALNRAQIYPGVHYRDNSCYKMYREQPPCPRARWSSERLISLPMHLHLTRPDVQRVADALASATTGRAAQVPFGG
jgi:dTDP-4-amino-4,6-dideoxygalactose transaminase